MRREITAAAEWSPSISGVPAIRIQSLNRAPPRREARHVLYWMVSARRLEWSFALDRAVEHARALALPLVILEELDIGSSWASQRMHAFALDGMREHALRTAGTGAIYHPYVEPLEGAAEGLVEALASETAVVVTDDWPITSVRRRQTTVAERLDVAVECVDGNGLLPVRAAERPFVSAHHFRRFLQKHLGECLLEMPSPDPLAEGGFPPGTFPSWVAGRWPSASAPLLSGDPGALSALPVPRTPPATDLRGGGTEGRRRLARFLADGLSRYGAERKHPDAEAGSGLSPYLHWGHVSVHEVFHALSTAEGWSPARLGSRTDGAKGGWWGVGVSAEAFLDELVTWRELGFGYCHHVAGYDRYESLPAWALETLDAHAGDARPFRYGLDDFDRAETHDPLWNAAQRELREAGRMHNYLRMLWGKKILEWTRHPREALEIMVELNNRYALDGRDPNSYTGIFWVLGRFDRGWPERPVYGKVRSMSSESTRRKLRLHDYLDRWSPPVVP